MAVVCAWAAVVVSLAVVKAADVFLLSVLGVLFGVLLTNVSGWISRRTELGYRTSVVFVTLALLLSNIGIVYVFGRQIEQRLQRAASHTDETAAKIRQWMDEHPVAKTTVSSLPFFGPLLEAPASRADHLLPEVAEVSESSQSEAPRAPRNPAGTFDDAEASSSPGESLHGSSLGMAWNLLAGLFRTTLGIVMNLAVVLFVGVFLALDPDMYRNGIVQLFPQGKQRRVAEILDELGRTLWHWLLGRLGSMLITGLGTAIALLVIGVPLPWMLGLVTGLLTFIPNLGPAIGLAFAVLVSLPEGGTTTLLVIFAFLAFQLVESYVLTPLIQQQQVDIPPAVLIAWQVLLGMLAGMLGVLVSTPILAMIFVVVREVYLRDVLDGAAKQD